MEKLKFSATGKNTFLISWIIGTVILLLYVLTKSWILVWAGFYYVLAAAIINMIIFFHELLAFVIDVADHKPHGNSALLILLNVPIAALYFLIFFNL
ncbi:hypothetical protein ODZ84_17050 [Chryseobacterium fluminis]|uniref:hypothetical protein n=1 Tax=Chryseobacterium fluminis TaxID=2983606 RepID=UPI002250C4A8|nr:hypothetical protein [Chryseobacterium sp. MMS21-Ot14]UZT96911.1 hypothetical protein ODZ84_17050 [Chryseobacterium sp. MMS21-Ot14]